MRLNRMYWSIPAVLAALFLVGCGEGDAADSPNRAPEGATSESAPADNQSAGGEVVPEAMKAFADNGEVVEIRIEGNDRMQYNLDRFEVPAGAMVRIILTHTGQLPAQSMGHNVVVLKKGIDPFDFAADVGEQGGSLANDFAPSQLRDRALALTPIIGGGETTKAEFKAPDAAGEHAFLCSFTGHAGSMNGIMEVK